MRNDFRCVSISSVGCSRSQNGDTADNQVLTLLAWREREVAEDNEAQPPPVFAAQVNRWGPHSESRRVPVSSPEGSPEAPSTRPVHA